MKKRDKFYQILNNSVEINGISVVKTTIVYYDEYGLEETRESFNDGDKIKDGYIPIYLMAEVPSLYSTLPKEIKNFYLLTINDNDLVDEYGNLNNSGKEFLKLKIRKLYSNKISNIDGMQEYVERNQIDGTPIPQNITDNRDVLKNEYHNIINYLGL